MFLDKFNMTGKRIVVFGASSGIGKTIALQLDELGAEVIIVARREDRLIEVKNQMHNSKSSYYVYDLNDLDNISGLFKDIVSAGGTLDGMVYCAGISVMAPIKLLKSEMLNDVMKVNFYAFFECVRQFSMKGNYNKHSKIVAISSIASVLSSKGQAAYAASKAALDSGVVSLAKELIKKQINVNAIRPANIKTEMYYSCFIEEEDVDRRQPLGFMQTDDVADMAIYLMSGCSNMITGQIINVDAGMLLSL